MEEETKRIDASIDSTASNRVKLSAYASEDKKKMVIVLLNIGLKLEI